MTTKDRVRRLLADLYKVRIVDVWDEDLEEFARQLNRHNFMLVDKDAVFR